MKNETLKLKGWASGLIDGEGCFSIHKKYERNSIDCFRPEFQIQLRDDNHYAIESFIRAVGCGYVIKRKAQKASLKRNLSKPTIVCMYRTKEEVWSIVKLLDEFPLRGKKKLDYEIWKKAVLIYLSQIDRIYKHKQLGVLKQECSEIKIYTPVLA